MVGVERRLDTGLAPLQKYPHAHQAPQHTCLFTSSFTAATFDLQSRFFSFRRFSHIPREDCSFWKRVTLAGHKHSFTIENFATDIHMVEQMKEYPEHSATLRTPLTRFWLYLRSHLITSYDTRIQQALAGETFRRLAFKIQLPRIQRCQTSLQLKGYSWR